MDASEVSRNAFDILLSTMDVPDVPWTSQAHRIFRTNEQARSSTMIDLEHQVCWLAWRGRRAAPR